MKLQAWLCNIAFWEDRNKPACFLLKNLIGSLRHERNES